MKFEYKLGLFPFVIFLTVCAILFVICLVLGAMAVFFAPHWLMASIFGLAAWQFFISWLCFIVAAWIVIYRHNDELRLSNKNKKKEVNI